MRGGSVHSAKRCLMVPLAFATVLTLPAARTLAQTAPVNVEVPSDACVKGFATLREEAVARGNSIKDANARHAGPDVTCKLIASFAQSEIKMIKYLDANSANCGIPPQIGDQIRVGHTKTDIMLAKVCNAARQARSVFEPPGPVGDFPQLDRR